MPLAFDPPSFSKRASGSKASFAKGGGTANRRDGEFLAANSESIFLNR
jgi:hypothetical protein